MQAIFYHFFWSPVSCCRIIRGNATIRFAGKPTGIGEMAAPNGSSSRPYRIFPGLSSRRIVRARDGFAVLGREDTPMLNRSLQQSPAMSIPGPIPRLALGEACKYLQWLRNLDRRNKTTIYLRTATRGRLYPSSRLVSLLVSVLFHFSFSPSRHVFPHTA